ncbi:hypothetical protein ACN28S_34870 [Cystobacter fuscus]
MDENRALRDELERVQGELRQSKEALARLRAHHAREQDSLVRQLEEARRELATLRARVSEGPSREAPPGFGEHGGFPGGRSHGQHPARGAPRGARAPGRGGPAATGDGEPVEPADLRLRRRRRPPSSWPGSLPGRPGVCGTHCAPRASRPWTVSCPPAPRIRCPCAASWWGRRGCGWRARGARMEVQWREWRLLVLGRRSLLSEETQVESFHDHRGVKQTRTVDVREEAMAHFLWGYGEGLWLSFTPETDYTGLGERRGLSHLASLQALVETVRERAPQVVSDDRLLRMPTLSLPLVDADRAHESFAELLWQAVLDGLL